MSRRKEIWKGNLCDPPVVCYKAGRTLRDWFCRRWRSTVSLPAFLTEVAYDFQEVPAGVGDRNKAMNEPVLYSQVLFLFFVFFSYGSYNTSYYCLLLHAGH